MHVPCRPLHFGRTARYNLLLDAAVRKRRLCHDGTDQEGGGAVVEHKAGVEELEEEQRGEGAQEIPAAAQALLVAVDDLGRLKQER